MSVSLVTVLMLVQLAADADWSPEKPAALVAFEEYRRAIATADIEWRITLTARAGAPHYFRNRIAGDDVIVVERGTADGVRSFRRTSDGMVAVVSPPEHVLGQNKEVWNHVDGDLAATLNTEEARPSLYDIRNVGTLPVPQLSYRWDDYLANIGRNDRGQLFRVHAQGDIHIVEMKFAGMPDYLARWHLDETRFFQPVCTECLSATGEQMAAVYLTYEETDNGQYFPATAEYVSRGQPVAAVEVLRARINDASLPARLTPEDIGVDNGVNVRPGKGHPLHGRTLTYCDGELLSPDEFRERMRTSGVKPGTTYLAYCREHHLPLPAATQATSQPTSRPSLDEWARYTYQFILKYTLNEEQTQKALSILKRCHGQREAYLSKHKSDFGRLDERLKIVGNLKAEEREKAEKELQRERERLLKPLNDIFEQQLKPRLEKLPTRAQRKAAEEGEKTPGQGAERDGDARP